MTSQAVIERSPELLRHLADPALRAIVLAGAAALALRLLRVKNAAVQLTVWTIVLYAALALPVLGWLLPALPLPLPAGKALAALSTLPANRLPESALLKQVARAELWIGAGQAARALHQPVARTADSSSNTHRGAAVSTGNSSRATAAQSLAPTRPRQGEGSHGRPDRGPGLRSMRIPALSPAAKAAWTAALPLAIYLLVLGFLLARLGLGLLLSHRLRRRSCRVSEPRALRWLEWHALAMGIERAPLLLESTAVSVPLTLGVARPVIVLPGGWREWETAKLSPVIAHELAHVKRRDSLTRTLSLIYRSVFWFSPLGWWLAGRLADLAEEASDAAALDAGAEPIHYAEVLMSFFGAVSNRHGRIDLQGVAMARGGDAKNRIENVLARGRSSERRPGASTLALMALLAAPVVYVTAATHPILGRAWFSPSNTYASATTVRWQVPAPAAPQVPQAPAVPDAAPAPTAAPAPAVAPVAPLAPVPPEGAEIAPPNPPEPPPAVAQKDTPVLNGDREGMDFAIVQGASVTVSGSEDDRDEVKSLQKKIPGDFIWFIHSGDAYVIRDPATVEAAQKLYAPMEELGKRQEVLGKQQEDLGRQQEALGQQMEKVRVQVPGDLEARLKKVEAMIRELGANATQEELGRLQGELGNLQGEIGNLQGKAGAQQGSIGRQQGALGAKQGELGRKQGELGREQGRLARQASRQMQEILQRALASGSAQRAPE